MSTELYGGEAHLPGIIQLCADEGWPSFQEDPDRTHRVLTDPGVPTVVALEDDQVVGFAYIQSDGEIQAHLSLIAVAETYRRRVSPGSFYNSHSTQPEASAWTSSPTPLRRSTEHSPMIRPGGRVFCIYPPFAVEDPGTRQ